MSDFWTADWHFDHSNILTYCSRTDFMSQRELKEFQFAKEQDLKGIRVRVNYSRDTIERMNTVIIDKINAVVGEDDTIWNLGDVIFAGKDPQRVYERLLHLRSRIRCRNIVLLWGNHDKVLQFYRPDIAITEEQFYTIFDDRFAKEEGRSGLQQIETVIQKQWFFLNHYSLAVWPGNHKGTWQLYGHSHGNYEDTRERVFPNARSLDIGIDNRRRMGHAPYSPWSFKELSSYMAKKSGEWVDHHVKKRN